MSDQNSSRNELSFAETARGVVYIVVNHKNEILFCSPACIDEYNFHEHEVIEEFTEEEKKYLYVIQSQGKVKVLISSTFEIIWHGEQSRMILLENNPARMLISAQDPSIVRFDPVRPPFANWISFRCKFDPSLEMLALNDQVVDLTGYSSEQLLTGKPQKFRSLMVGQQPSELWEQIQDLIESKKSYQIVYKIQNFEGEERWLQEQGRLRKLEGKTEYLLDGWILDISERKQAARLLWECKERYRNLLDVSSDSALILDEAGKIVFANKHFTDLIGVRNSDSISGKFLSDFVNLTTDKKKIKDFAEAFEILQANSDALTVKLKSGSTIPIEVHSSKIINSQGHIDAYIILARNVEQKNATLQALRESEARYRAIVEENPEMIIRFSPDGIISFANKTFCSYTGIPLSELTGEKLTGKVSGPGHHQIEKQLLQLHTDMEPLESEFSIHGTKGVEQWYRWKTAAVRDSNGKFIEYQSIGEEITAQKKSLLSDLESQNRLREIMENVKLVAIMIDSSGNVTFCNSYFLDITGWSRAEVMGKQWAATFVPKEFSNRIYKILVASASDGNLPVRYENPITTRDGQSRLIAWYNTTMRDSQGNFIGVASIGEDITERRLTDKIREAILRITQAANQLEDLDSLYKSIQNTLSELMTVDNFFIALYDREKDILSFPFFQDQYDMPPLPGKPKRGLTEYVLRTGKTTLINPETFDALVAAGEVESIGTPSIDWIGVPLIVENEIIGVMGLQTYSPGIRYDENDLQVLAITSNQIAMAIDRKRSEQALRDSQKRTQLLIAASTDAIFTATLDGTILDCNDVALEMYGYSREEMLSMKVTSLITDELKAEHPNYMQWELDQGGDLNDIPNRRKDGSVFPVSISIRQAITDGGPVLISYVRDITEQKQAARVIIESEEKFRALAENSAAGIFIHSGGKNIYVNPMWSNITEYPVLDLLMRKPIDLLDPSTPPAEREKLLARLIGKNLPDRFEFNIATRSGEKRVIDLNITGIKFENKDAVMGTAIDITNRKEREHELEVIAQMSEALRISISRMEVLETAVSKISDILNLDGAHISLIDKTSNEIVVKKANGIWTYLENTIMRKDQGLSGHIVTTGLPYVNHQPGSDPYIFRPDMTVGLASIAGVPMIANGEIIGTMVIGSKHKFSDNDIRLLKAIGDFTASAIHRADLFEQSSMQARELEQAYNSTLEGWALALELRDKETQGHSVRIANLTLKLARRMGVPESEMENIRRGALLHDIGKLGVPDTILLKHGTLTADEWQVMKKHPTYAFEMLSQLKDFKGSIEIPYCHHEWWDGSGYPRGLEGKDIPLAARIFCIVDVWDALTSDRPYRNAWKKNEALAHIINQAGTHFDPDVVNEFIQMVVDDK